MKSYEKKHYMKASTYEIMQYVSHRSLKMNDENPWKNECNRIPKTTWTIIYKYLSRITIPDI